MADCTANCNASCQGSCSAQANLSCDIMCQAQGSAMCTAMLQAKCTGGCMSHQAIFCDGNFINAMYADNCVADLKALFNITVTGYASANASCDGGTCMAMAKAGGSASCAMTPASEPPLSGAVLGIGVGAIAMGALRRRRRLS
jgi:MYXO-CTERM domain-containing protein